MSSSVNKLVPMAHVADVSKSTDFYRLLGFEMVNSIPGRWAYLRSGSAEIMLARASGPIVASDQAVLFYMYSDKVSGLREELIGKGVSVSATAYPDHMPRGEIRTEDLDGYVILIGQLG